MMRLGEIIINRPAKQLNKPLTYEIPDSFGEVPIGTRVAVPLGASKEEGEETKATFVGGILIRTWSNLSKCLTIGRI